MTTTRPPLPKKDSSTPSSQSEILEPFEFPDVEPPPVRPRDPGEVAAGYLLDFAFAADPALLDLARQNGVAIVVTVPAPCWAKPTSQAWASRVLFGEQMANGDASSAGHFGRPGCRPPSHVAFVRVDRKTAQQGDPFPIVASTLSRGGSVVGFASDPESQLPAVLMEAADATIILPKFEKNHLFLVLKEMTGSRPTLPLPESISDKLTPDDLRISIRHGQDADRAVQRLASIFEGRQKPPSLTLDQIGGMPEAINWGRSLAEDLSEYKAGRLAWSDIDRGVLLSGPPGTGKTTFARALAGSCDVPLIASSLGEWQAAGHLGDLLKAMRKTFDQARTAAPCILLVDEIDGFGNRAKFKSQFSDYSIQVVNGFLELLDGTNSREGIIVVGATNHPDRLDQAITRAGRLDRHIRIGLPDQDALEQIMRHHLKEDLADIDLSEAAFQAIGRTGADVERWIRGAKRRARSERRPLDIGDLITEIRGKTQEVSAEVLRRCAVHEAGHAIAIALHQPSRLHHVSIRQTETEGGRVLSSTPDLAVVTEAAIERLLVEFLAGRAAEEIVLGSISSGAGGGVGSDLANATLVATTAVTAFGFGGSSAPLWSGMPSAESVELLQIRRPDIARQVENRLDRAYAVAKNLIVANIEVVNRIVDRLLEVETVAGEEVVGMLRGDAPTIRDEQQ